jgi:hypothetical protein
MGVNANGGPSTRANWAMGSKFGQFMNVFTLDYGLSVWAKLDDARFKLSGKHDFVKETMIAIRSDNIQSKSDFYKFIDETVVSVDNIEASKWLKSTSLFSPLTSDTYTLKLLPVQGDIMNIRGNDKPDYIYPFLVERDGLASVVESEVFITIKDSTATLIHEGTVKVDMQSDYSSYSGLNIKDLNLETGSYTVEGSTTINGKTVTTSTEFDVN